MRRAKTQLLCNLGTALKHNEKVIVNTSATNGVQRRISILLDVGKNRVTKNGEKAAVLNVFFVSPFNRAGSFVLWVPAP